MGNLMEVAGAKGSRAEQKKGETAKKDPSSLPGKGREEGPNIWRIIERIP